MLATIISFVKKSVTLQVTIEIGNSMLESEEAILKAVNEVGTKATQEVLSTFDTDGSAIFVGPDKLTSKGQEPKTYQTPYGEVEIAREEGTDEFKKAEYMRKILDLNNKKLIRIREKVVNDIKRNGSYEKHEKILPPFYSMLLQLELL